MHRTLTAALLLILLAWATPATATPPVVRVYDGYIHAFVSVDVMLDSLKKETVVVVGEQHDSAATHAFELALLEGLMARRPRVTLALEMFERDVQTVIDRYLTGAIDEAAMLAGARPWPSYASDYRPLVERARATGLPVLATNVPRALAAGVARGGLSTLDELPADHRWLFARQTTIPDNAYRTRFAEAMQGHGGHAPLDLMFAAQCLKDDTMAETVADWLERRGDDAGLILHINGAFHSDHNLGLYTRLRARLEKNPIATVRIVPVPDVDHPDIATWGAVADWVVFVPAP